MLFWQRTHQDDKRYDLVRQWVSQKEKQMSEDLQERVLDIKREYVLDLVAEVARKSNIHDRNMIHALQESMLKL